MAITPREAIKLNLERDKVELGNLERQIDVQLKEEYRGEPVCVGLGNVNHKVLDEIKRRYTSAGWTVRYRSDQRDGDYLIFEGARK